MHNLLSVAGNLLPVLICLGIVIIVVVILANIVALSILKRLDSLGLHLCAVLEDRVRSRLIQTILLILCRGLVGRVVVHVELDAVGVIFGGRSAKVL